MASVENIYIKPTLKKHEALKQVTFSVHPDDHTVDKNVLKADPNALPRIDDVPSSLPASSDFDGGARKPLFRVPEIKEFKGDLTAGQPRVNTG